MPMSQAERDKEDAKWEKERPLREWIVDISAKDQVMPRALEDVIDVLSDEQKSSLSKETLDKYDQKKEIRSRKPK